LRLLVPKDDPELGTWAERGLREAGRVQTRTMLLELVWDLRSDDVLRPSAVRQSLLLLGLFMGISLAAWGGTYLLIQREMLHTVDARLEARMGAATTSPQASQGLPAPQTGVQAMLYTGQRPDGYLSENRDEWRFLSRTTGNTRITPA